MKVALNVTNLKSSQPGAVFIGAQAAVARLALALLSRTFSLSLIVGLLSYFLFSSLFLFLSWLYDLLNRFSCFLASCANKLQYCDSVGSFAKWSVAALFLQEWSRDPAAALLSRPLEAPQQISASKLTSIAGSLRISADRPLRWPRLPTNILQPVRSTSLLSNMPRTDDLFRRNRLINNLV